MRTSLALLGAPPVRARAFPAWPVAPAGAADALVGVLRSGHWWQSGGGASERLEDALGELFGVERAVCVSNGTVALEIALRASGVRAGHEVLVPAVTFVSTASAVVAVGAIPVPVDVDPDTWNVDITKPALSPRTRALIVVHLAGQPADLVAARRFCTAHGLVLVEDSAQAVGAARDGVRVGTVGDLATLSFQAGQLLPGGEGGAVLVPRDPALARRVELLANCGRRRGSAGYDHELSGTNGRINEFSAALVAAHLPGYEELWKMRHLGATNAARALPAGAVVACHPRTTRHDWYMLLLRTPAEFVERGVPNTAVVAALSAEGVPCQVLYPAWHRLPAFRRGSEPRACPHAEAAARRGISLHHRLLTDETFADDLALAWERLLAAPDALARWAGR